MATKPTVSTEWATQFTTSGPSGNANKTEPTASFKDFGQPEASPTDRQSLNYNLNAIDLWLKYLTEVTDEDIKKANSMTALRAMDGAYDKQPVVLLSYWSLSGVPPLGGGLFLWDATSTEDDDFGKIIVPDSAPATGRWIRAIEEAVTPYMYGKKLGLSSEDDAVFINRALQSYNNVFCPPDIYRLNTPINPVSSTRLYGVKNSSELWQLGQFAVDQVDEDLESFVMEGFLFDFRSPSTSRYWQAFRMKSHRNCIFNNYRFVRYDDQTVMTRTPTSAATVNTIDNLYSNWYISACANIDIGQGLEGYYYKHEGDAVTTILNTNIEWPEQFPSSVAVLKEDVDRKFSQLELNTDYTVSYDGSNNLTVILTVAPIVEETIHIWPSQPRTDGNRRPLSNNIWDNIKCDFVFNQGFTTTRWVDAERYSGRILLADNNTSAVVHNPYSTRGGQGGDFMHYNDLVIGYQSGKVTDTSTLTAFNLGPMSTNLSGQGVMMDLFWGDYPNNRTISVNDTLNIPLTGTLSLNTGIATVVGTGTKFTEELTKVGTISDVLEVEGVRYTIVEIVSDTELTVSPAPAVTGSFSGDRYNLQNLVAYDIQFSSMGTGQSNTNPKTAGHVIRNSNTIDRDEVTIPAGTTTATIPFELYRQPQVSEITVTPMTSIGNAGFWWVSNITSNTFDITIGNALAYDMDFGWKIEIVEHTP